MHWREGQGVLNRPQRPSASQQRAMRRDATTGRSKNTLNGASSVALPKLRLVSDEWFRSPDWSPQAQEEFERRLGRARDFNRSQYLRIKALALVNHGGTAEASGARELLVRVIEGYPDSGDVVMAHEHLAELDVREGQRSSAKAHYRMALRLAPQRHVYGDAALRLPELLIEDGGDDERDESSAAAGRDHDKRSRLRESAFRYAVARARLAHASGNKVEARQYAGHALREAARDTPDFPRHPTVGLVDADRNVLKEMRKLARL
jgi:tetratricopeptide (TPR) repeat protein